MNEERYEELAQVDVEKINDAIDSLDVEAINAAIDEIDFENLGDTIDRMDAVMDSLGSASEKMHEVSDNISAFFGWSDEEEE